MKPVDVEASEPSNRISQALLEQISRTALSLSIGQRMWPRGSKYGAYPQPVAIESSGWFDSFQEFLNKMPPG